MRILHTSDWHLGRSYSFLSLKEDQQNTLDEIAVICEKKQIDVVLIAGDIFNGINTPGYADEMFINSLIKISGGGKRAIIAISGNNDEGTRFAASKKFAQAHNIFLIKNINCDFEITEENNYPVKLIGAGMGYIKLQKNNEKLNVVVMPYSAFSTVNEALVKGETYEKKAKSLLDLTEAMKCPKGEGLNFGLVHFRVDNFAEKDNYHLISISSKVFNDKLDYVALGHEHRMVQVTPDANIFYSGSTLQTYIDEDPNKYVIVINTDNNEIVSKEFVKLKTPKRFIEIKPKDYESATEALNRLENCYVEITFDKDAITSEEIKKIKDTYKNITKFNLKPIIRKSKAKENSLRKLSPKDIFIEFYEKNNNVAPEKKLVDTFLEVFKGEEDNEAD